VYDEDGNRTALTTHEPSSTGECVLEAGGALESHTYDSADRLVDAGVEYNPFGDISSLPAADAGGASLKSAYYVDNQVQSQTQCLQAVGAGSCPQQEETVGYNLDPGVAPREDSLLRERTLLGDRVVRAQVVSITSTRNDSGRTWQIGLHTLERLAGEGGGDPEFTLRMNGSAPGASVMRTFDGRLIGIPLMAFIREFEPTGGAGRSELHFHLASQDKDEVDAVRVAALSGDAR